MTIRPGLCSVTFRQLDPAAISALAASAGLQAIEWGGDVHVPPGDAARAAEVARITADAGLAVASYGSYFRADAAEDIAPILDSAAALGADRIRVWAGRIGSADATVAERAATIDALASAAEQAGRRGISLALEFHGRTLADDAEQTLRVLDDVASPHLSTYWQPTVAASAAAAVAEYARIADRVSAVHVFSWWPATERLPLTARDGLWRAFFAAAAAAPAPPSDALLEFVPDDDPAALAAEAVALRGYLSAGMSRTMLGA
ncbi:MULTISPECIES: sugar phosphate isomerase/epimerase family protein [unclassified Microbacterium]|uniref:sugar phosphate isomerase/epimerase family protein n=1 Tax=unclassified Microbacterium TaxID=2609290 RepID=UPI003654CD29